MTTARRTVLGLLGLAAVAGAARARTPIDLPAAIDWTARAREALAPGGSIETALDKLATEGRFAGAVMASWAGKPLLRRAWGKADRDAQIPNRLETRFNIASAGKMFTTVGIGQLLEAGKLGLDDRLSDHLPDFKNPAASTVTIGQLLTHTSGFGSYFSSPLYEDRRASMRTLEDYLALVEGETPQAEPGGGYLYSNSGFVLLGAVIQRLTGRSYYDAMARTVFAPAGMKRTGYPLFDEPVGDLAIGYENGCFARPPSQCAPTAWTDARRFWPQRGGPAGGGVSTVGDFDAFVTSLRTGRLLKPATLQMLTAEQGRIGRPGGPLDAWGRGFGRLTIHGHQSWGHNGGTPGAQAQVDAFEEAPLTLVVLSNQDGAQRFASSALRRAAADPTPAEVPPTALPTVVKPG